MILVVFMFVVGCFKQDDVNKLNGNDQSRETIYENAKNKTSSVTKAEPTSKLPATLAQETAIAIIEEARSRNYNLLQRGGPCTYFEYINSKDGGYAFICDQTNSKEKIQNYLDEVFTPSVSNIIMSQLDLREINNKLAFSPKDWGSMRDWGTSKIIEAKEDGNEITYYFNVGLVDASIESKFIEIKLKYVAHLGWRVDTKPQLFL